MENLEEQQIAALDLAIARSVGRVLQTTRSLTPRPERQMKTTVETRAIPEPSASHSDLRLRGQHAAYIRQRTLMT